jgi:hypothetical protein
MEANESTRNVWCNRPAHEKHLSFAEWLALKNGHAEGGAAVEQIADRGLQFAAVGMRARHEHGQMNGLEKRYAAHLEMRKATGEIRDWWFESLKLRLAPSTFWSPDFTVQMPDLRLELHETKGHWEDDARVKIKWAGKDFGMLFRVVGVQWNKGSKDWKFEEFTA